MPRKGYKQTQQHKKNIGLGNPKRNKTERNCLYCGKSFFVSQFIIKIGKGKFCSRKCAGLSIKGKIFHDRTGEKHSEKTKEIFKTRWKRFPFPNPFKGRHHTEEAKEKLRQSSLKVCLRGEDNHFWKGGITKMVLSIRTCYKYRQWRSDVFTRDMFTCQKCGDNKGGNLSGHHIIPLSYLLTKYNIKSLEEAINCEELWNINNGLTLCSNCHEKTGTFGPKVKNYEKI